MRIEYLLLQEIFLKKLSINGDKVLSNGFFAVEDAGVDCSMIREGPCSHNTLLKRWRHLYIRIARD